jgi:hypothetical protein
LALAAAAEVVCRFLPDRNHRESRSRGRVKNNYLYLFYRIESMPSTASPSSELNSSFCSSDSHFRIECRFFRFRHP